MEPSAGPSMAESKIAVVIPARYASERLPGKPLRSISAVSR